MLTLSVITLPVLAPIAALLNLLFPGLMRDQWRQYRVAISVLMTQSTLLTLHWAAIRWWVHERAWWTSDAALTGAIVLTALVGVVVAAVMVMLQRRGGRTDAVKPTRVEYIALTIFGVLGLAWAVYQLISAGSPFDQMSAVTVACFVAVAHLAYRGSLTRRQAAASGASVAVASPASANSGGRLTTEMTFLLALTLSGAAFGFYLNQTTHNQSAGAVDDAWPTYRGNIERTGAAPADSATTATLAQSITDPVVRWTFDPKPVKGRVRMHASPTVVDGLVFIGAMHEIQTYAQGYLYCINAGDRSGAVATNSSTPTSTEPPLPEGQLVWRFSADDTAKAIFSSPSIAGGRVYIGEGYHQDKQCRLFCVDAPTGNALWSHLSASHVESSPALVDGRVYVGAGDDGVYCLDASSSDGGARVVWRVPNVHVDSSPLVVDGRVFVGSVIGDEHPETAALAIKADTGDVLWRVDAPLPVAGSPAYAGNRVYFALGNGKFDHDVAPPAAPAGAVWCLDAATGDRVWTVDTPNAVLNSPAVRGQSVVFTCRDGNVYSVDAATGSPIWKRDVGGPMVAAPVIAGDAIYVVTVKGHVICLAASDGTVRWQLTDIEAPDSDVYASPTFAAGRLYVAIAGKLHCIAQRGK